MRVYRTTRYVAVSVDADMTGFADENTREAARTEAASVTAAAAVVSLTPQTPRRSMNRTRGAPPS